jgi:hypothetical protein
VSSSTGSFNSSLGYGSLNGITSGSYNTALGSQSLNSNTTASNNTAVGYQAGQNNLVGTACTFIGTYAGQASLGIGNQFFGYGAGYLITTGANNTILGAYNGNQGGLDIRTASNYIVLADGAGNLRGVFDANGNYLVGTTTAYNVDGNGFNLNVGTSSALVTKHITGTPTGAYYALYMYGGSAIGSIQQTGTTAVLYNTTSDYRLKNNVTPIENALSTIKALNPVSFKWIDGREDNGFLAHEIQTIIPNCVTGEKDAINEDGTPKYQQMDNSGVIPFLVKAIQELQAEIQSLKSQLKVK